MRMRDYIYILFFILICSSGNVQTSDKSNSRKWSTLEECRRTCTDDEPPRYCYYHFTIEYYVTMGSACTLCRQNKTDQLLNVPKCQCVEADGVGRTILSINRLLPGPSIQVCQGDMIIVDLENRADGLEVILHWHGLFQKGYQYYDGVPMVTQCPILSGDTFRYQFPANNAGTYFYHSHLLTQRMDGQYGSLIIRQTPSTDPNWTEYDEDLPTHIILVSDWMHHLSTEEFPGIYSNPGQTPDSLLINGRGRYMVPLWNFTDTQLETFYVEPGKRYRFRFINGFTSVCPSLFTIEKHNISIIAQDGDSLYPASATSLHTASGERIDFVLTANQTAGSYWIQLRGLRECGGERKIQQLAILSYSGVPKKRLSKAPTYDNALPEGRIYNPPDGQCDIIRSNAICVNQFSSREDVDARLTKGEPDEQVILPFRFHTYNDDLKSLYIPNTYNKFFQTTNQAVLAGMIDNISYSAPKMPLISQPPDSKDTCNNNRKTDNCDGVCYCTHVIDIKKDSVVEFVLYDESPLAPVTHPFHLHGYAFTVLKIGQSQTDKNISRDDINMIIKDHQKVLKAGYDKKLPKKDSILVPTGGYVIFRFIADNPGWWFFHCHFDWHSSTGMEMVIHVGEQEDLPPIPPNFPKCGSWQPPPQPFM